MEFLELVRSRYSVRAYEPTPVEEEKLQMVLDAARLAPTAANRQPFRLIVIATEGREAELQRIYAASWFTQAPLIICASTVPDEAWLRVDGKGYADVDVNIDMDHLILAARSFDLGTCWIAACDPAVARDVLGLPDSVARVAFTPVGYAADQLGSKTRKPLSDLVRYERW